MLLHFRLVEGRNALYLGIFGGLGLREGFGDSMER